MKKLGFTLAETLITLAIIGVVAAMTIPTLTSKYQKHVFVTGMKKAYSQLTQAAKMVPLSKGCPAGDYDCAGWPSSNSIDFIPVLAEQFKVSKLCTEGNIKDCVGENANISDISGMTSFTYSGFIAQDGTLYYSSRMSGIMPTGGTIFPTVYVDVNGLKGPNQLGRDRFVFYITGTSFYTGMMQHHINGGQVIPVGSEYDNKILMHTKWTESSCNANRLTDNCTGRVFDEGAMNY